MRSASEYRRIARDRLRGNWATAVAASLLVGLLGGGDSFSFPSFYFNFDLSGLFSGNGDVSSSWTDLPFLDSVSLPVFSGIALMLLGLLAIFLVIGIVLAVIGSVMDLGSRKFFVRLIHGEKNDIGVIFHYFKHFGKAFVLRLLINIFTFLWSLLFIIPGIVASYRYAMAPYLMAKDPTLSPMAAIRMSKELMRGKKGDLFCLQLSFIGWSFLCLFSCGIGYLFLNPYTRAAEAAFALDVLGLSNDIPSSTADMPGTPPPPPPDINNVFDE